MSLKDNLKYWREQKGYDSAKDFANSINMPYHKYVSYEKESWPNEENLVKIATALNVSIDTLLGFSTDPLKDIQNLLGSDFIFSPVSDKGTVDIEINYGSNEPVTITMPANEIISMFTKEKEDFSKISETISIEKMKSEFYRQMAIQKPAKIVPHDTFRLSPKGYHPEPPRTETPTRRKKE